MLFPYPGLYRLEVGSTSPNEPTARDVWRIFWPTLSSAAHIVKRRSLPFQTQDPRFFDKLDGRVTIGGTSHNFPEFPTSADALNAGAAEVLAGPGMGGGAAGG